MVSGLVLSGRFASSSPKGRALGKTANFAWTAKASHFEERLPRSGRDAASATEWGLWHGVSRDGEGEAAITRSPAQRLRWDEVGSVFATSKDAADLIRTAGAVPVNE